MARKKKKKVREKGDDSMKSIPCPEQTSCEKGVIGRGKKSTGENN